MKKYKVLRIKLNFVTHLFQRIKFIVVLKKKYKERIVYSNTRKNKYDGFLLVFENYNITKKKTLSRNYK